MADVGLSFSPTNQSNQRQIGAPVSPVQDAIKLLSFRMPTVFGANAPAGQSLLGGPTAFGAQLGSGVAENWLRSLFSGMGIPAQVPGASSFGQQGLGSNLGPFASLFGGAAAPQSPSLGASVTFQNGQGVLPPQGSGDNPGPPNIPMGGNFNIGTPYQGPPLSQGQPIGNQGGGGFSGGGGSQNL